MLKGEGAEDKRERGGEQESLSVKVKHFA